MTPKSPGWYWFKANDRTPTPTGFLRQDKWVILFVSPAKVTRDGPAGPLVVRFPQASYTVDELFGEWSERIPEPFSDSGSAMKQDWRIGLAVTPKMRTHYWFRHLAVVRRVHPETPNIRESIDVEIYHGDGETTILNEPADEWMTA